MSRGKKILALSVAGLAMVLAVGQAMSQETQQGGRNGGRRGGGPNADQAQGAQGDQRAQERRQQREQRMKDALGVTDEEWKLVLQPKIEKVQTLNMELFRGQFQGRGGRGGQGGGGPAAGEQAQAQSAPQTDFQKQREALQKVLENKEAKVPEIRAALAGYRDSRAKVRADLEKAQKDLRGALSMRQEAQLVMMGTLE
jgi:hypothetical protein